METSKLFAINWNDVVKGFIMAVLTPVMTILYNTVSSGSLTFNWKQIGIAAIAGFSGYLLKNFLSPPHPADSPIAK